MHMNPLEDAKSNGKSNGQRGNVTEESPLWEYIAIFLHGKWVIVATVALAIGLVTLYTLSTKPFYEASSLILIDMKGSNGVLPMFGSTGTANASKITNELEILKSQSTVHDVAQALRSTVYLDTGKTKLIPILALPENETRRDTLATVDEIAQRLSGVVDFAPVRESDIITITARSKSPQEAALIANSYAEVYTTRNLNTSRLRSKAIREFLQTQLQSRKALLDTAEINLQNYMRSSGIVSLDAEGNKVVEQLSQLEAQRDAVEVEKSAKLRTLESYNEEFAKLGESSAKAIDESNDNYIRLLQEQIAKLEVQRDIVIAQNPDLVDQKLYSDKLKEINQQTEALRKTLAVRTQQFLGSLMPGTRGAGEGGGSFLAEIKQRIIEQNIELQGLEARKKALDEVIQDYEEKFNQIPKKSIELAKLQRSRLSNEKLYLLVDEKYNETAIQERSEFGYVNIIDPATVPLKPIGPRFRMNLALGFLVGLTLGIGIVFGSAFLFVRVRTPEDLKRQGFFPLSSISRMESEIKKAKRENKYRVATSSLNLHLVTFYRPMGPIAESYRHLRTNLLVRVPETQTRCVVVSSAIPGEGKTTTVCNLAISLAQSGKKVLLVNADMRRPMVHHFFGLENKKGLGSVLAGNADFEEVLQRGVLENLDILASGEMSTSSSELLGSKEMKELLAMMKRKYDFVLLDTPPVLAVTDTTVLATETDGVILVASAGTTTAHALKSVADFFREIHVKVIGAVLNNFDMKDPYNRYSASYPFGYYGYESGYFGSKKRRKQRQSSGQHLESQT